MELAEKKLLESINAKLSVLVAEKKKATWVSVSWVTKLTGWGGNEKRLAREQGIVEWRLNSHGIYEYLLESIPDAFIIKKKLQGNAEPNLKDKSVPNDTHSE